MQHLEMTNAMKYTRNAKSRILSLVSIHLKQLLLHIYKLNFAAPRFIKT